MEKLSEIISKTIYAVDEGKMVGYILCPVFEDCFLQGYIVCDDEVEQEKFLSSKDIVSSTKEAIFINSIFDMQNVEMLSAVSPLGKFVFDSNGTNFGKVEECYIENNFIKKLQTNICEIMSKNIATIGKDCVIFAKHKKNQKKSIKNYNKNINLIEKLPKVEILNKIQNKNETLEFSSTLPIKAIANKSKLIGKKITKDIFGFNNEIIAKQDEIINEKIIKKANKHNKINLLFFYSK